MPMPEINYKKIYDWESGEVLFAIICHIGLGIMLILTIIKEFV